MPSNPDSRPDSARALRVLPPTIQSFNASLYFL